MTEPTKLRNVPKSPKASSPKASKGTIFCKPFKKPARGVPCGYNDALESFTSGFDRAIAKNLLNEFVEAIESVLNELSEKTPSRNMKIVKPLTHRLIGLCPIYKAHRLSEISQLMEKEMLLDRWDGIEAHVLECRDAFAEYMGVGGTKKTNPKPEQLRAAQKARLKIVK